MTHLYRRQVLLATAGVGISTSLAGCGNPDSKPMRMLTFREVRTDKSDGDWLVSLQVVNKDEASDELGTFHAVEVHGYARDGEEVCSKSVGTVSTDRHQGNSIHVEMTCSGFPTMLTYSADESPCDEEVRTVIKIAVYDEENGWSLERHARECNEGLPPDPRD